MTMSDNQQRGTANPQTRAGQPDRPVQPGNVGQPGAPTKAGQPSPQQKPPIGGQPGYPDPRQAAAQPARRTPMPPQPEGGPEPEHEGAGEHGTGRDPSHTAAIAGQDQHPQQGQPQQDEPQQGQHSLAEEQARRKEGEAA
jgi:hypothetical protein